jgi:hypothetical protein
MNNRRHKVKHFKTLEVESGKTLNMLSNGYKMRNTNLI